MCVLMTLCLCIFMSLCACFCVCLVVDLSHVWIALSVHIQRFIWGGGGICPTPLLLTHGSLMSPPLKNSK